ncbi:MAG: protein kinase, partial [Actinomycetota bacterium]
LTRPIAVKILHPHLATDHGFVTRFRREALASARLSHPSIVAVYDTMSEQGIEAIVMELVEGRTLRSVLDEAGVLPPPDVVDIGVQISDALDVAHRSGVVHRDIKPANIMVGTDRRIMVTDFGIAKATKDEDLTHTGTLLGTAKYLAPEQVTGEPVDPRADIYALGIVLFEAATGGPPFLADTDAATALARLREEAPRCRERRADVPVALDEIIAKAMARNPDDRYDRALSLRSALANVDLTQVGPIPTDLSTLPPPVERTNVQQQPGVAGAPIVVPNGQPQPPPGGPAGSAPVLGGAAAGGGVAAGPPPAGTPSGHAPVAPTGKPKRAERKATKQADKAAAKRAEREAKEAKRRQGRQRPTRTIAAVLIIGGLMVAGALLLSLGRQSGGGGVAAAERLDIVEAIPFDPEGVAPFGELNNLAPLAIDGDTETIWRTDGYNGEGCSLRRRR